MKKEEIACRILEFWYIIEFLSQDVFPTETKDNKKRAKQLQSLVDGSQVSANDRKKIANYRKVTLFHNFPLDHSISEQINQDNTTYTTLRYIGSKKHLCIGKLRREFLINALYSFLGIEDQRPEEDNSEIALMTLKVDNAGIYESGSLRISPILWGINKCKEAKGKMDETIIYSKKYSEEIFNLEKTIDKTEPLDNEKLGKLYDAVCKQYIEPLGDSASAATMEGLFIYTRYREKKIWEKEEPFETDHSELINGFYTDDLLMVKEAIQQMPSSDKKGMYNKIIDYIVSTYYESIGQENCTNKIDIRNNKEAIAKWLSADKSPLGKWPSVYTPALMQQIAINIAIAGNEGQQSIFSVNGPPGTGKTTLLKEIIASNIVDRAKLLCEYDKPDNAFEERKFQDGVETDNGYNKYCTHYYAFKNPAIAQYGMLVASCNNAAVENITKELPDGNKILNDLNATKENDEEIANGIVEIANCFNRSQSPKKESFRYFDENDKLKYQDIPDIYFSKLAANLLAEDNQSTGLDFKEWGLISAPMGKRKNISRYYYKVLNELIDNFLRENQTLLNRERQYKEKIKEFKKQWKKVSEMRNDLSNFMKLSQEYAHLEVKKEQLNEKQIQIDALEKAIRNEKEQKTKLNNDLASLRSFLIEKEDSRKWYEILLGKWIQTERLCQIAELKEEQQQIKNEIQQTEHSIKEISSQIPIIKEEFTHLSSAIHNTESKWEEYQKKYKGTMTEINSRFWESFDGPDEQINTHIQVSTPWTWYAYNREREKLFFLALQVHKEFILSSKCCRYNFINLAMIWKYRGNDKNELCSYSERDKRNAYSHLLNTLFLLTPVISTTFAATGRFLKYIDQQGSLGTLIIDEAGQASPHVALGALWRCRKAIIVGDPKQVEPVVTDDADAIKYAFSDDITRPYLDKTISVQELADKINPYGSYIEDSFDKGAAPTWVGCPLVVHRRCINPMFDISNELSYDGTMKLQTKAPKATVEAKFIEAESYWMNKRGKEKGNKNHFVNEQGALAYNLVLKGFKSYNGIPDLYIISPFNTVINGIKNKILTSSELKQYSTEEVEKWVNECCGTVHKFQGKEAGEVIFLLGCDESAGGAIKWVKPNIVNVAVTRAKYRLYVIGDYNAWKKSDYFRILKERLAYKEM